MIGYRASSLEQEIQGGVVGRRLDQSESARAATQEVQARVAPFIVRGHAVELPDSKAPRKRAYGARRNASEPTISSHSTAREFAHKKLSYPEGEIDMKKTKPIPRRGSFCETAGV